MLRGLGHRVDVVAGVDRHTWVKHPKVKRVIPGDSDVVIACSAMDVFHAERHTPKTAKVFWWLRGWENWQVPDNGLLQRAKTVHCISNTGWIADRLKSNGIHCDVCYSGLDINYWHRVNVIKPARPTIGCLYHRKYTKRFDMFEKIYRTFGNRFSYVSYGAFVGDTFCDVEEQPDRDRIRELYSMCDVWLAPTELEGFHNVAAEAALCGCEIVCCDKETNGMFDYANGNTAHIYVDEESAGLKILQAIKFKKNSQMIMLLYHIGDREKNMKRLLGIIS